MTKDELLEKLKTILDKVNHVNILNHDLSHLNAQITTVRKSLNPPGLHDTSQVNVSGNWLWLYFIFLFLFAAASVHYLCIGDSKTSDELFLKIFLGIGSIVYIFLKPLIQALFEFAQNYPNVEFLPGLLIMGLPFIPAIVLGHKLNKRGQKREIQALEEKNQKILFEWEALKPQRTALLAQLNKQRNDLIQQIDDENLSIIVWCSLLGLHESYASPHPLRYFISYLERGRSDTLKETINLYEDEMRKDRQEVEAERHRADMRRRSEAIRAEVTRGADAAEEARQEAAEAAFWGAAATFVAATSKPKESSDDYRCV